MKLIIGMAKSNLDLKGAKSVKLELDFLRLAYAVQKVEAVQKGYLMVAAKEIKTRADQWKAKYQLDGEVEVVVADLDEGLLESIIAEKKGNVKGMLLGTAGIKSGGQSVAKLGKSLMEDALKKYIEEAEGTTVWEEKPPLGIQWDYCGKAN